MTGREKAAIWSFNLVLHAPQRESSPKLSVDSAKCDLSSDLYKIYTNKGIWRCKNVKT